jgi:hypothetical protein
MTYYRMAVHDRQTATWIWKTTTLCSLQAVLQLLRSFRALPQNSIRVFTAASKEDLNEMLERENTHGLSGSVTAAQFLRERLLHAPVISTPDVLSVSAASEMVEPAASPICIKRVQCVANPAALGTSVLRRSSVGCPQRKSRTMSYPFPASWRNASVMFSSDCFKSIPASAPSCMMERKSA